MNKEFSFEFDKQMEIRVVREKLWHHLKGIALIFACVLIVLETLELIAGTRPDIALWGIILGIAFICAAVLSYIRTRIVTARFWGEAKDRTIKMQITDEGVKVITELYTSDVRWKTFNKVTKSRNFLFIWFGGYQCYPIPVSCLDEELERFVRQNVKKRMK